MPECPFQTIVQPAQCMKLLGSIKFVNNPQIVKPWPSKKVETKALGMHACVPMKIRTLVFNGALQQKVPLI